MQENVLYWKDCTGKYIYVFLYIRQYNVYMQTSIYLEYIPRVYMKSIYIETYMK